MLRFCFLLLLVIHACNVTSLQRSRDEYVPLRISSLRNSHHSPAEGKFAQRNIFSFVAKLSQKNIPQLSSVTLIITPCECERIADCNVPAAGTEKETLRSKTARPWSWNEFRQYNVTKTSIAERYELFIN